MVDSGKQQNWWAVVAAVCDRLVCLLVAICWCFCCCWDMLLSSVMRTRRLSVRLGLVVAEIRCGGPALVTAGYSATGRGGDESGVNASGEDVDVFCSSSGCVTAGGVCE
jgi:hypothetical protein